MRQFRFAAIIVGLSFLNTAIAETEIHKCTDADGNIAYSQLPCVTEQAVEPDTLEPDTLEPDVPETDGPETDTSFFDEAAFEAPVTSDEPVSEEEQSACKKRYRNAIDVIDAEIGRDYSPEKAEDYKQQLLELTRKLRQC